MGFLFQYKIIKKKFFILQVREGGYDHKVNETVNAVTAKTTEIGHKTWGIMKGFMAMASEKLEGYTSENGVAVRTDSPHQIENVKNGYYQEFRNESDGWNNTSQNGRSSTTRQFNSVKLGSWDDWDQEDHRKAGSFKGGSSATHNNDGWAGWDDPKDDDRSEDFHRRSPSHGKSTSSGRSGKSDAMWGEGGFL